MKHYEPVEISKYIDGELDKDRFREIEKHLLLCDSCRNMHKEFLSIKSEVRFADIEVPSSLYSKIEESAQFKTNAKPKRVMQLAFGLAMLMVFISSFAFSLQQGKAAYIKKTVNENSSIADEFISGISPLPSGSLSSLISYSDR
ncbi:MAG: anti-sigma factor [bacterium]